MKRTLLLNLIWFAASVAQLPAQTGAEPSERQARALKVAASVKYQNLITQHAKTGDAPAPDEFTDWLLAEANNPSLLRDQIAEDIALIEANGRNENFLESYFTTNAEYVGRLVFRPRDVKVTHVGGGKGVSTYQASFHTQDNFHRGWSEIDFVFTFKVKVEFFKYTHAYQVTVISYPKFEKKSEKEEVIPRVKE